MLLTQSPFQAAGISPPLFVRDERSAKNTDRSVRKAAENYLADPN